MRLGWLGSMVCACAAWALLATALYGGEEAAPPANGSAETEEVKSVRDAVEQAAIQSMLSAEERQLEARQHVIQGDRLQKAGRHADALEAYMKALNLDPTNEQARRGRDEARRHVDAYTDTTAAAITRELERVRVGEQHSLMEVQNHIENAVARILEAEVEPGADLALPERSKMIVKQKGALDQASEHLARAKLLLAGISARIDTATHKDKVALLEARVRAVRHLKEAALQETNNVLALQTRKEHLTQAQEYIKRQKEELLKEARLHKDMQQYDKADRIVREVLAIDPSDSTANGLQQEILQERRYYRDANIKDREREERQRVLEKIEERAVPEVRPEYLIKYPDNWEMMTRAKASQTRRLDAEEESEADREIRRRLEDRHTVEFVEASIDDVIAHLRQLANVNIIYQRGGEDVAPINLSVRDMRLDNILRWIMNITNLNYQIRDGVIHITTAERLEGAVVTEVYDVRDIAYAVGNARTPPGLGDDDDDDDDDDGDGITLDEVVRRVLAEYFAGGGAEVELDDRGNLTVVGIRELQRRVQELLQRLRTAQAIQVSITSRFLTVTDDFWEEFSSTFTNFDNYLTGSLTSGGTAKVRDPTNANYSPSKHFDEMSGFVRHRRVGPLQSVLGANLGTSVSPVAGLTANITQAGWLGQVQTQWAVRLVKESAEADELFAPHIIVYNNRMGWFRWETEIHYVQTYQLAPAGTDLEAVIDQLQVGTLLQVRPTVSADKRYITLDIFPRVIKLMAMNSINLVGDFTDLTIDLPTIFEHRARTFATLPDGGSILISGLAINVHMNGRNGVPLIQDIPLIGNAFSRRATQKEKRNFVIMCNARMILLDEEEAKQSTK